MIIVLQSKIKNSNPSVLVCGGKWSCHRLITEVITWVSPKIDDSYETFETVRHVNHTAPFEPHRTTASHFVISESRCSHQRQSYMHIRPLLSRTVTEETPASHDCQCYRRPCVFFQGNSMRLTQGLRLVSLW
jgi:hypothetical protein